jgi:hypothetical protein
MNELPFVLCPECMREMGIYEPSEVDREANATFTAVCPDCELALPVYSAPVLHTLTASVPSFQIPKFSPR